MAKAQQKKQPEEKPKLKVVKVIPFLNGKRLKKAEKYPPETIFLAESDYKELLKAKKQGEIEEAGVTVDELARELVKYREEQRRRIFNEAFEEGISALFEVRNPRDLRKKTIKPGEGYRLIPFWNGTIPATRKNHPPGTIFITLIEYNCLASALKAGDIKQHQVFDLAKAFVKYREPEEIEAIEEYQRKNPPPEPKAKKKKKAEDDRLFPVVNDKRIWDSEVKDYKPEEILWLTGKELDIVWRNDFGRKGLKALLEVVKNYKLPLVDGRRIPKSKIEEYPASKIEYVRMKAYIEDKMPVPSIEEVINQQESKIKALAKDISQETAKRFVNEIIPESVSKHLTKEQIEVQKQDFAYGLSESLTKQLSWELSQARVEAKKNGGSDF